MRAPGFKQPGALRCAPEAGELTQGSTRRRRPLARGGSSCTAASRPPWHLHGCRCCGRLEPSKSLTIRLDLPNNRNWHKWQASARWRPDLPILWVLWTPEARISFPARCQQHHPPMRALHLRQMPSLQLHTQLVWRWRHQQLLHEADFAKCSAHQPKQVAA